MWHKVLWESLRNIWRDICFEDFKQEIQTELKKMIKEMSNRVNELEARVKGLESKVVSREDFTKEYKELRIEL
jgi:cell division protein FtsB